MSKQQQVLLKGLQDLYNNNILTDVILCAVDQEFPCHRIVLAASSPYFRAMFTADVREQGQHRVHMHDLDPTTLRTVLDYIYTADVEIDVQNAQSVFIAANMLQIVPLLKHCAKYMESQLCIGNCIEIYNFASFYSCGTLKAVSENFVLEHFREVMQTESFNVLTFDDFSSLISQDSLGVDAEEIVFEAILKWLEYDAEKRQQYFPELFNCVRLPLLKPESLDMIANNIRIREEPECKTLIDSVKSCRTESDSNLEMRTSQAEPSVTEFASGLACRPRLGMWKRKMLVFAGGAEKVEGRSLTSYDPFTKKNYYGIKQHSTFDFRNKIDYHRLVVTDENKLYFLGGIRYEDYHHEPAAAALDVVLVYNEKTVTWTPKSPMQTCRCAFSAVSRWDKIFVTGGKAMFPRGPALDTTECYHIDGDTWTFLAPMPISLYHHASAIYDDSIYVFGGIDEDEQHLNTVFQYKINSDSWTFIETMMSNLRAEFTATMYNDHIYLIGGANATEIVTAVEIFNPKSRRWQIGTNFPEERKTMTAVLIDDFIYVCGGVRYLEARSSRRMKSRMVESRDLYKYDLIAGDWSREVKLVQYANIQACAVCVLNTKYLHESCFSCP